MIYDVGDGVSLSTTVKDSSGNLVNTPTLTLTVTKPDGSTATPTVTNTGSGGVYTASLTTDQAGTWAYAWVASGTVVAVQPGQFTVRSSSIYVVSLEELKAQLNRTDDGDDVELRTYLASATRYVESRIGGPVSVQTFTERHFVDGNILIPRKRPLVSITSITPDFGGALPSTAYLADTEMNRILLYYSAGGWHTVVYTAGNAAVGENVKLAGLIVAQHLWDTQNGFAGRRPIDDVVQTGFGFAVPRRAEELLGAGDAIGGVA